MLTWQKPDLSAAGTKTRHGPWQGCPALHTPDVRVTLSTHHRRLRLEAPGEAERIVTILLHGHL